MSQRDETGGGAPKRVIPVLGGKSLVTDENQMAPNAPATLVPPPPNVISAVPPTQSPVRTAKPSSGAPQVAPPEARQSAPPPQPAKPTAKMPPPVLPKNAPSRTPNPSDKSLGSRLFDDVPASGGPQPSTTGARSPTSGTAAAEKVTWPANVPSLSDAEKILAGSVAAPAAAVQLTQDFLSSLTPVERSALGPDQTPALKKLRTAIAGRWRLSFTLATRSGDGREIDMPALDQLLTEVDVLLSALGSETIEDNEELKQAFDGSRGALAKHAVDIAEIAFKAHQTTAQGVADIAAEKYKRISARIISNSSLQKNEASRRPTLMVVLLIAAVLGAGGFHGYRFLMTTTPAVSTLEGAPPNTYGTTVPNSGGLSMVQNLAGKPFSEAELQQFRSRMEAQGKGIKDMGNGMVFIVPKDSPLLGTPNPPNGAPTSQ